MAGREFYGHIFMCSKPTCCCNTVHLELASREPKERFSISLDVVKRLFVEDIAEGSANQLFGEKFADELTDGEWDRLHVK
jgi:hypothetical protein